MTVDIYENPCVARMKHGHATPPGLPECRTTSHGSTRTVAGQAAKQVLSTDPGRRCAAYTEGTVICICLDPGHIWNTDVGTNIFWKRDTVSNRRGGLVEIQLDANIGVPMSPDIAYRPFHLIKQQSAGAKCLGPEQDPAQPSASQETPVSSDSSGQGTRWVVVFSFLAFLVPARTAPIAAA
ncbi:hypothetical protein MYCTH_2126595 [Thermothelomyces thermophilus ATCC 42464]|uniref:Uncharacterized protein n=1 Tax=Thermothelomyces thermophilus (strain ATCC 42464 / BCRC 31852 / DSM 1799) TaxID=573729 RepID=G2QE10_THET4|nr:uncharacterized protein MYCTH_2126595 [Thermothelomyces thermophilus ATCC 42464]AEO57593.1 hypothetical protein MYCTH_2126595 [Thermothelomyces thermophilus ATCC 42464]